MATTWWEGMVTGACARGRMGDGNFYRCVTHGLAIEIDSQCTIGRAMQPPKAKPEPKAPPPEQPATPPRGRSRRRPPAPD